ncbi:MAG: hypothetical protein RSP_28830 [Rhodanobacter sp.]
MNKQLDDLIEQADGQLRQLEEDARRQSTPQTSNKVDSDTAREYNSHISPPEPFTSRHPIWVAFFGLCFLILVVGSIYTWITAPRAEGPYQLVEGTVQSSYMTWTGSHRHGNSAAEKISLPDGRVITLYSRYSILLKPGTQLGIRIYKTGAITTDRVVL